MCAMWITCGQAVNNQAPAGGFAVDNLGAQTAIHMCNQVIHRRLWREKPHSAADPPGYPHIHTPPLPTT